MGLHSSLKRAEKMGGAKSILKRNERIKWLIAKGAWKEDSKVTGLPKIKVAKIKTAKKEKAAKTAEEGAAAQPANTAAATTTPAAKTK